MPSKQGGEVQESQEHTDQYQNVLLLQTDRGIVLPGTFITIVHFLIIALHFIIAVYPLAVLFHTGCTMELFINVILTICGFLPGVIHAIYVILREEPQGMRVTTNVNLATANIPMYQPVPIYQPVQPPSAPVYYPEPSAAPPVYYPDTKQRY